LLDFVLLPETGKSEYSGEILGALSRKVFFCGVPSFNLSSKTIASPKRNNSKEIRFVYAGMLNREYRNPDFMLKIFRELSKRLPDITLHIYGRGNCHDILEQYMDSVRIFNHGMVKYDDVLEAFAGSDFVLNISNRTDSMMPSKVFELFSTGKPIINFTNSRKDPSKRYFQLYPSVGEVMEWGDFSSEIQKIERFIINEKGKYYDPQDYYNNFKEYTPQHVAKIIRQRIESSK
jgi:glycosyltransferase involved in cell wall biosynthesis